MKDAIAPITKKYAIKKFEQHDVEVDKATTDEEAEAVVLSNARLAAKSAWAEEKKAQAEGGALLGAIDQAKKERCLLDRGKDTTVYAEVSEGTATHMRVGCYMLAALLVVAILACVVLGGDGKVGVEVGAAYNASSTVGVSVASTAGTSVVCGVELLVVAIAPVTVSQSDFNWHTVPPSLFEVFPFAYRLSGPSFPPTLPGPHCPPAPEKHSSSAFPFGMISPVLYAAAPSERVAKGEKKEVQGLIVQRVGEDHTQCYRELQAVQECEQVSMVQTKEVAKGKKEEEQAKENDAVSKELVKQQSSITAQSTRHRHRIIDESDSNWNPVPRSHATGSTTPHLLLLAPTPLVVNVDAANGKDAPSCVKSPTLACKTIRYALEKGQLEAPKQSRSLLEIQVAAGEYLGECSEESNTVAMAITLKKKAGAGEVLIDCKGAGSLLNITHEASATSQLEGLTIANGVSKVGGGAASVRGGRMVLKECGFRGLKSLADGHKGGGAVSLMVSAVLRKQHSVYRIDRLVGMPCSNARSFVVSIVCRVLYHWRSTGVPLPSAPPLLVPAVRSWLGSKRWPGDGWRWTMHSRSEAAGSNGVVRGPPGGRWQRWRRRGWRASSCWSSTPCLMGAGSTRPAVAGATAPVSTSRTRAMR
jgi:hypothetical protein